MYRMCHDDPAWPDNLDRTISTHYHHDDAIDALHRTHAEHVRQLEARGDRGAALALAVVDAVGATVMCLWAGAASYTRYAFPDPEQPGDC